MIGSSSSILLSKLIGIMSFLQVQFWCNSEIHVCQIYDFSLDIFNSVNKFHAGSGSHLM